MRLALIFDTNTSIFNLSRSFIYLKKKKKSTNPITIIDIEDKKKENKCLLSPKMLIILTQGDSLVVRRTVIYI